MSPILAEFAGPGQALSLGSPARPELADGEVWLRVTCATVCGSDRHTYHGRRSTPLPGYLGHEAIGIVEASRRTDAQSGDRVTFSMLVSCGECDRCVAGLGHKCRKVFKYGHENIPWTGTYGSHMRLLKGTELAKLPGDLPDEAAGPINCAFATGVAVADQVMGNKVRVIGGGLVGLATALAALLADPGREVEVVEPDPQRQSWARRLGMNPPTDQPVDCLVECAGVQTALEPAMAGLKVGGRLILAGLVHPDSALPFTAETLIRNLWTVVGVHNYAPRVLPRAVDLAAEFNRRIHCHEWTRTLNSLDELDSCLAGAPDEALRVALRFVTKPA